MLENIKAFPLNKLFKNAYRKANRLHSLAIQKNSRNEFGNGPAFFRGFIFPSDEFTPSLIY